MPLETLAVFRKSFQLSTEVFQLTLSFPKEERYSLTDQVRRSSRSISANIGEAYRKRQYPKHWKSKLSDTDAECTETLVWLYHAQQCGYIEKDKLNSLKPLVKEIGKMLGYMIRHPDEFA